MTSAVPLRTPINVLWIGTRYFTTPYTIANMRTGTIWQSPVTTMKFYEYSFEFQFQRLSELDFEVICTRFSYTPPDNGISFQLQVIVTGFSEGETTVELQGNQLSSSFTYSLVPCYRETFPPIRRHTPFEMKFVIYLFEYEHFANYVALQQEEDFIQMKEKSFKHECAALNMGYILKSPGVKDIFTGRQDYDFFVLKSHFIIRTVRFSKEVASYLCAKEMGNFPLPDVPLSVILSYIMYAEESVISDQNIIDIYLLSCRLGLNYLKVLARDVIMVRLGDMYFALEALRAAVHVADEELFEEAAGIFCNYEQEIMDSPNWQQMRSNRKIASNIILHQLSSRLEGYTNGH